MKTKKKFKKVVERDYGDFSVVYPFVCMLGCFVGGIISLFEGITFLSIFCISCPLWYWIPIYIIEVKKKVYWEEFR